MTPEQVTNDLRADWAEPALQAFRIACNYPDGEMADAVIADLICNLLHLAAREDCDPLALVRTAVAAYCDERDYPPDGWAPAGKGARVHITVTQIGKDTP